MKWTLFTVFWFAWGALVASYAIADDQAYEQSEQAQVAEHANQFIAKAYGRK